MYCSVCGNQIEDNSKFCPACGAAVESEPAPVEAVKKKRSINLLALLIGLAAIVVIGLGGFFFFGGLTGSDTAVAFVKKDTLYYKANPAGKKDALEVVDLDSKGDSSYYKVLFSKDGAYLYFFTESDGDYGTLSYIKVKDIRSDVDKNEDNIQEIESGVYLGNIFSTGETGVVYFTKDSKLEYFDGKESKRISKDCYDFNYDEEKNVLIYAEEDGGYKTIYGAELSGEVEPKKIDNDVDTIYSMHNSDFILYSKKEKNELYEAGFAHNAVKIADNFTEIRQIVPANKQLIYVNCYDKDIYLSEFVEDDCLESDKAVQKPDPKNFAAKVGLDTVMSSYDYQYYSLYPEEMSFFYDYLYKDEALNMSYYYNSDTDTVYYYDGTDWYHIDTALYERAIEDYESIAERMEIRESLAEESYGYAREDVYYYESGKEPECLVTDVNNVVVGDTAAKCIAYKKHNVEKIKMSQITSIWDVHNHIDEAGTWLSYCQLNGAEPVELEQKDIESIIISEDKTKAAVVIYDENMYELLLGEIKNNALTNLESLTKEKNKPKAAWRDNILYYLEDVEDGTGDLCIIKNGESQKAIKNIGISVDIDDENNYITYEMKEEYDSDLGVYAYHYNVELFDSKYDKIESFSDCYSVEYFNKESIVFMKNGKLYFYDGTETNDIAKNVDGFAVYVKKENVSKIIKLF